MSKSILIHGSNLTTDQKNMLKFNGMSKPEWVANHSFYFDVDTGKPTQDKYPVCHSLSHLEN